MQELHRRGGLDETVARRPPAAEPEPEPDSEPERRTDARGGGRAGGGATDGAATGASGSTADDAPTDGAGAQRPEATTDGGAAGAAGAVSPTAPAVVGETAAGPDGAAGGPELLMPEPPTELSDEERARLESTSEAAGSTAEAAASLPPGEENVSEAREAVSEPEAETQARVENDLVEALGERPAPSPEIEELCARIYEVIRSKRPPDEESLVEAEPEEMAQEAGGQLDSAVRGDTERVRGEYDRLEEPPSGTPQQTGGEPPAQPGMPATPDIGAADAVPDGVSEEHVDLSADVAAAGERMDEAGMTGEAARLVESGPIADARAAHGELESTAEQAPARVLADQQAVLADARADMTALQASAVQGLVSSRRETAGETQAQQEGMVRSEEQTRERISERAQEIFSSTQDRVLGLLEPLPGEAMEEWQAGVDVLSTQFERSLQRVERWVDERYSGAGGAVVELWDDVTGMPDWVTEEYDRAEQAFGDGVCALIRKISADVNGVIAACEALIEDARTRIDRLFTDLPDGLADWAAEQRARFDERLDGLHQQAMETRDDFTRDLTRRAAGAVQEVRTEVHALRQEARGLLGQFQDAVTAFLDDPARAIINGLLQLAGIPPASFWAVVDRVGDVVDSIADDPMNFANNLLTALKQGFQGFFDRFAEHALDGLLDWLFSGLGSVGVEIPADFSLTSVITFFLQLMGLTWDRIREILARHIGEENVALLERAYEVVSTLVEQGPPGVYAMIEEQLNPQTILDQVIQAATDYLVETLIQQATVRIIALLNPAGAIVQAVEAVYRVLDWVFTNAARIFSLVETVVNGAAALVRGDTSGMAGGIESALAGMIPTAIDFLAGYLGLGDLPETIAETIRGFQEWVLGFVDRAVGFVAGQARRLLSALGLGDEEEEADEPDVRTDEEKQRDLDAAIVEAETLLSRDESTLTEVEDALPALESTYRLSSLELVREAQDEYTETVYVKGEVNPTATGPSHSVSKQQIQLIDDVCNWLGNAPVSPAITHQIAPTIPRFNLNNYFTSGSKLGLKGYQKCHLVGAIWGDEMLPISLAPRSANQFQRDNIEMPIRAQYRQGVQNQTGIRIVATVSLDIFSPAELRPWVTAMVTNNDKVRKNMQQMVQERPEPRDSVMKKAMYRFEITEHGQTTYKTAYVEMAPPTTAGTGTMSGSKPV